VKAQRWRRPRKQMRMQKDAAAVARRERMDTSRILRVRIRPHPLRSTPKSSFGCLDRFDRCTKFVFCLAAIIALSGIIALLVAFVPAPPPPERSCDAECASGGVEREDYSSDSVRDRTTWSSDGRRLAEAEVVLESSPIGLCGVDASACRERLGDLKYVRGHWLSSPAAEFGELSAIALLPSDDEAASGDGDLQLLSVTDQGYWVVMPARPEPVDVATLGPLLDADGASLATLTADGASLADAEGVTLLPSGDALVSFEREHRVLRYVAPEYVGARGTSVGVEQWVRTCDSVIEGFGNAGIEAVQALNASHVVVACEHPPSEGALHGVRRDTTPVRVLDVRAPPALARTLHYPIEDGWGVVDFALLAPGTLLVLERTYVSGWGNAIRLRRLGLTALDGADGTLLAPELLLELRSDVHVGIDNFEGLACLPTSNGTARVFMVSDNNFHPSQRTLLLEFELPANARPINATAVPPPAPGVSPGAAFGIAAAALVGGAALAALVLCCRARAKRRRRSGDKAALARRPTADIRAAVSQMQLAEVRGLGSV